jgi:hypothetical protein
MSTSADNLVDRYLAQLDRELRGLPAPRRREVMQEIAGHIATARRELGAETDPDVLNLLERVGDPSEIAADARERFEVAALILLPFGALIIPFAGWFVGVFFLWASDAWNRRDKLIGTLVVPGGLLLPLLFGTFWATSSGSSGGELCRSGGGGTTCTQIGGGGGAHVLAIVLLSASAAAPLAVMLYLALRLRRG